jgi:hypothetical protein
VHDLKQANTLRVARTIEKSWKRAALFIATPTGFYFDTLENIIKNKGAIKPFRHAKISQKIQTEYLELLNEFIKVA